MYAELLGALEIPARLIAAYLLALPVGWDLEARERTMGVRTFPLVALASAAYITLAGQLFTGDLNAQARVLQGLVTGIGFIGAGAILKLRETDTVRGTATAASVWITGALGAAVAYGQFGIAILLSAATFATFRFLTPVKEKLEERARKRD